MTGLATGFAALRRLVRRHRCAGLPVILMYHRIGETTFEAGGDPWGGAVSPAHFAQHLEVLTRRRQVLSLQQLAAQLAACSVPHHSAVVTFDDGYADNLHAAKPLLEKHDVPATVFAVTGAIDRPGGFWWDELAALLLRPGLLPATLKLKGGGALRTWTLDDAARLSVQDARATRDWRGWEAPPTPRHALFLSLWRWLRCLPEVQRRDIVDALRHWAGPGAPASPRPLDSDELGRLAADSLVEVGAHGVTHACLPDLTHQGIEREVEEAKTFLEARVGREVSSFSYPHGAHDAASVACVRQAGFARACITGQVHVRTPADPLRLPRIQVENWDGEEFERRLSHAFID